MYVVPNVIRFNRFTDTTVLFFAASGGSYGLILDSPVTGLVPGTDVAVYFIKPGTAPVSLTINGTNFRELGRGVYEYDLSGSLFDEQGFYALEFVDAVAPGTTFKGYTAMIQVSGALESQLEKVLGFGVVPIDETYGGTIGDPKPLQILSGGQSLDFVRFYLFLESDWDAGDRDVETYSKGIGESGIDGDWKWPIMMQPEDYVLLANTSKNELFELSEIKTFTVAVPTTDPQPTVSLLSPNTGPSTGGTLIVISGTDFVDGATVTVGGTAATSVSYISSIELRVVTPAGSVGAQAVVVTNPDIQFANVPGGFTYS